MSEGIYVGWVDNDDSFVAYNDGKSVYDIDIMALEKGVIEAVNRGWHKGRAGVYTLARVILWHATRDIDYVQDMDRHFANWLGSMTDVGEFNIPAQVVLSWAVDQQPLRHQIRLLMGRNCPSCG